MANGLVMFASRRITMRPIVTGRIWTALPHDVSPVKRLGHIGARLPTRLKPRSQSREIGNPKSIKASKIQFLVLRQRVDPLATFDSSQRGGLGYVDKWYVKPNGLSLSH